MIAHGPEDQRDDPEHALDGRLHRVRVARIEHRLDGVQGARPDIPEHDPQSTDGQRTLGDGTRAVACRIGVVAHQPSARQATRTERSATKGVPASNEDERRSPVVAALASAGLPASKAAS